MRLDRFVSHASGLSRKQARNLIRRGKVKVDGIELRNAASQLTVDAEVECAGRRLELPHKSYLMMHKPCGLLSATRDDNQATVLSLLPPELAARVHLVGRLDKDTSGLLLLTDDGAWSHAVSSPRRHCAKIYIAQLAESLVPDAEQRLAEGLMLRGESRPTRPAVLSRMADDRVRITISEGRYHQVKRMFAALGNRVVQLHREAVGGLSLDSALAPGEWRALSRTERELVLVDAGVD